MIDFAAAAATHRPALLRYCRHRLADPDDAEDAVQEALARALAGWGRATFATDAMVRPWLYRIAHNVCVSAIRDRRAALSLNEAITADGGQDPVRAALATLAWERVLANLDAIVPDQRAALLMTAAGYMQREIAARLGVPLGTVHTRVFRGRAHLRALAAG